MKLSEYLFERVREAGAKTLFGIPGDFALPLFRTLDRLKIPVITFTHEPALGYAADAYARLTGFSAAIVTYGAGGLNMINSVAQAYAEKSPLLVISGAPEILSRKKNLLIHHRVKTFESQKRIYDEICCASVIIERADDAAAEIDYVINHILTHKRPGYIEIPRDLNDCEIYLPSGLRPQLSLENRSIQDDSIRRTIEILAKRLNQSKQPLIYVGVEVKRLGMAEQVANLINKLNIPFTTSMEGKASVPETHPNFVGTYMGSIGPDTSRIAMQQSDLILNIGTMMSDVNLGLFSGGVDPEKMIHITAEGLSFDGKSFPNISLTTALFELLNHTRLGTRQFPEHLRWSPQKKEYVGPITTDGIVALVNSLIKQHPSCVILDVGDILFASSGICSDFLLAPSYYASMGFSVPAAIASCLAVPTRKTLVLVGDGAFLMTGIELGTAKRFGLSPLIVVLNNGGYDTMKAMDDNRSFYDVPACDFVALAKSLGVEAYQANSMDQLHDLLKTGYTTNKPILIEAMLAKNSRSLSLKKMGDGVKKISI